MCFVCVCVNVYGLAVVVVVSPTTNTLAAEPQLVAATASIQVQLSRQHDVLVYDV